MKYRLVVLLFACFVIFSGTLAAAQNTKSTTTRHNLVAAQEPLPYLMQLVSCYGQTASSLAVIGKPDTVFETQHDDGQFLTYTWRFVTGQSHLDNKMREVGQVTTELSAEVSKTTKKVTEVYGVTYMNQMPQLQYRFPKFDQIWASMTKRPPELWCAGDGTTVDAYAKDGDKVVYVGSMSRLRAYIADTPSTDFTTGQMTTKVMRNPGFAPESMRAYTVYIGPEESHVAPLGHKYVPYGQRLPEAGG